MKAIITYYDFGSDGESTAEVDFPLIINKGYIDGIDVESLISIDVKPDIYDQETETWIKS